MGYPLLLDTSVVVWLFQDRSQIGKATLEALSDDGQLLMVSYLSLLEMKIKAASGKLLYDDRIFDDLAMLGIKVATPGRDTLKAYRIFSPANKDPFDNLLVATAIEKGATLLTSDNKILALRLPGLRVVDARK